MAHFKFFNHYVHTRYLLLGLLEFALLFIAAHMAVYFRFGKEIMEAIQFGDEWFFRNLVFATVMLLSTVSLGVYQARLSEGFASSATRTVVAYCLVGTVALTILYYAVTFLFLGRGTLFVAVVFSLALVLPARSLFFSVVDVVHLRRRVVVLGAGKKAAEIKQELSKSNKNIEIIAYVRSGEENSALKSNKVIDSPRGWHHWVRQNAVNEIVIALDERRRTKGAVFPLEELLECKMAGLSVIEGVKFLERETGKLELDMVYPGWLLFAEGFSNAYGKGWAKRVFDIVLSLTVLFFCWPLMLVVALAVYLDSKGPVIYRQERVGLNGRCFNLLKFRSMVVDAEKGGEAIWAQKNDSRVTKVGNVIRNLRLDELPQIYNVLRGDMSFVGPRPERPQFVEELKEELPFYGERHHVKPGLMGWAQLNYPYGASVDDAAQKLRYDLYYIKNYSLLLDIIIVVQTVEVILLGKGVR